MKKTPIAKAKPKPPAPPGLRWGVEKRLEFIEFRLFWEGRINRKDLIDTFGVSIPQSSVDLNRYLGRAPDNMVYDKSIKCYLAGKDFKPVFLKPDASRYLAGLRSISDGLLTLEESWLKRLPVYDAVPVPRRSIDPNKLRRVLIAIREGKALQVKYQSLSRPDPTWRWITPHAIAFDGFRWHVRAFCHIDEKFKDFLLGRVLAVSRMKKDETDHSKDVQWHRQITVRIGPHPGLTENQRKVVELDYGMENGELGMTVRVAFLFYMVKRMGLAFDKEPKEPRDQQIVLLNREDVKAVFVEEEGK